MKKVNIIWKDSEFVIGGGNQFLQRLRRNFIDMGIYSDVPNADVILYNSHHNTEIVKDFRSKYTNKKFIHRIDGPIRLYNHMGDQRDDIVVKMNEFSDGIIFQSWWSREEGIKLYPSLSKKKFSVIYNASDFKKRNKKIDGKIKIVATSISDNINKGYDIYSYLDRNLNFNKYEFTFVGKSPVKWNNIVDVGVKNPNEVSEILKKNDIFITASKCDPCSNSLIEALSVGLPSLALNSGGHTEIISNTQGGILFNGQEDIIKKLEVLSSAVDTYSNRIHVLSIEQVAMQYIDFFEEFK